MLAEFHQHLVLDQLYSWLFEKASLQLLVRGRLPHLLLPRRISLGHHVLQRESDYAKQGTLYLPLVNKQKEPSGIGLNSTNSGAVEIFTKPDHNLL
jgi:hypothetical protein